MKGKAAPLAATEQRIGEILTLVLVLFIMTRLYIVGMGYLSVHSILTYKWFGKPLDFLEYYFHWDSGWYMSIVRDGYSYLEGKQSNVAFYPLYPLLVKLVAAVTGHAAAVGFLISNLGLLAGAFFVHRLMFLETRDSHLSRLAVLLLLINPMSFFHSIFYAEGLFLGLTAASFYFARRDKLLLAGLLGMFATLTRMAGVFSALPIACQAFGVTPGSWRISLPRDLRKWAAMFLPGLGIVIFFGYLWLHLGDPFLSMKTQAAWFRHFSFADSIQAVFRFPRMFRTLFFITLILSLGAVVHLLRARFHPAYPLLILLNVLLPLSSGSPESFPRYMSVVFPIYMAMAMVMKRHELFSTAVYMVCIGFLTVCTILFVNGYWMT